MPTFRTANTRVLGLLNGEYHIADRLEPEQYASLSSNPKSPRTGR
ncbi:hypothetical protein AB7M16_004927 [Bradyrhizobium sp. USDA 372]